MRGLPGSFISDSFFSNNAFSFNMPGVVASANGIRKARVNCGYQKAKLADDKLVLLFFLFFLGDNSSETSNLIFWMKSRK